MAESELATRRAPASVLIASGLDPSGGAGFIADVRVAAACGARPIGVLTALTVQDTGGVRRTEPVDVELFGEQLGAVLTDIVVGAVKIGLVPGLDLARALASALELTDAPIVWDPVFAPTRGPRFGGVDPLELTAVLASEAALITPNLAEAEAMTESRVDSRSAMRAAAVALNRKHRCAVLLKGGHLGPGEPAVDVLATRDGLVEILAPRVEVPPVHGTGCFLSTATAAELAVGADLEGAVRSAKERLTDRLRAPSIPGRGAPAII